MKSQDKQIDKQTEKQECNVISPIWRWLTGRDTHILPCCAEHDLAYEEGGTGIDRLIADNRLFICVIERGYPKVGILVWLGVRLFGWRHFGDGGNKHEQNI